MSARTLSATTVPIHCAQDGVDRGGERGGLQGSIPWPPALRTSRPLTVNRPLTTVSLQRGGCAPMDPGHAGGLPRWTPHPLTSEQRLGATAACGKGIEGVRRGGGEQQAGGFIGRQFSPAGLHTKRRTRARPLLRPPLAAPSCRPLLFPPLAAASASCCSMPGATLSSCHSPEYPEAPPPPTPSSARVPPNTVCNQARGRGCPT